MTKMNEDQKSVGAQSESDGFQSLKPFFYPRSIAVVGVSKNPAGVGTCMVRALQRFGFSGKIFPVNPHLKELLGLPVYASVLEIPEDVDFARIYVPTDAVRNVVTECRQKRVAAVEIFTGGFGEIGTQDGRRLEKELAALSGSGMRIIGPNCFGVYSPAGCVTQIPGENYQRESGTFGFLSQSGGLSEDIFRYAGNHGLKFSHGISYGNACDVNEVDLMEYFEADQNTHIVGAYLEGVKTGTNFMKTVRRLARKKPTIIWKGGLTPAGARMTASHTGSMAGNEKVWQGFFRQTGAVQVMGLEEFLDTASAFYHLPAQSDRRIALICGGGGSGVALSDACSRAGLTVAELDADLKENIAACLPKEGTSANNPIDVGPPFPPGRVLETVMENLAASGQVGSIVMDKVTPSLELRRVMGYSEQIGWNEQPGLREIPVNIVKKYQIPVIVILREGGDRQGNLDVEQERRRLRDYYLQNGVGVFPSTDRALMALGHMVHYYRNRLERNA